MNANVVETVVSTGLNDAIVGVLCRPEIINSQLPAVLLINSGILHRAGPCRNSVLLARALAKQGYVSLRFDYSGLGDSQFSGEALGESIENNVVELKSVMDFLSGAHSINQFVVHGLCSGARDALAIAVDDERVVGISQIDGYAYRNLKFYINKFLPKLFSVQAWFHSFKVRLNPEKSMQDASEELAKPVWSAYPPRRDIEADYTEVAKRGVRMLVAYTGSWDNTYNYEKQFFDMFEKAGLESITHLNYMPYADHLMSDPAHRNEMFERFFDFLNSLKAS